MAKKFSGKVSLTRARMIYEALGFKTAHNWNAAKLTKKLEKLDTVIEGAELDKKNLKKVNEILRAQNKGHKVIVIDVDDIAADKRRAKDVTSAQKRVAARNKEKKSKTAKNEKVAAKKNADKSKAKKQDKKAVAASDKKKKPGIIMSVLEFIKEHGPVSEKKILSLLKKRFPDKDSGSMGRSIPKVPGYLKSVKGIDVIRKNDKGLYYAKK